MGWRSRSSDRIDDLLEAIVGQVLLADLDDPDAPGDRRRNDLREIPPRETVSIADQHQTR